MAGAEVQSSAEARRGGCERRRGRARSACPPLPRGIEGVEAEGEDAVPLTEVEARAEISPATTMACGSGS